MSYLNQVTGYRKDLLQNRSIIKRGVYSLIEPDGLVKNTICGFEDCSITILSSPRLGAAFVDYILTIGKDGKNHQGFGADGIEVFFYLFEGTLKVWNEDDEAVINNGGFIFCPEGKKLYFENLGDVEAKAFLYKRRYDRLEAFEAYTIISNTNELDWNCYEGMEDVKIKNILPSAADLGFDVNFHILSFRPGASHGYIETHIQEHGAYIFSGEGMYRLDNEWIPVKEGDYIFMGAYCMQAAYGIGRDAEFAYLYSKDCNRDVSL